MDQKKLKKKNLDRSDLRLGLELFQIAEIYMFCSFSYILLWFLWVKSIHIKKHNFRSINLGLEPYTLSFNFPPKHRFPETQRASGIWR